MYQLNNKIRNLVPYQPISGTYDIRLDANESPFELTGDVKEQVMSTVENVPLNRYPDPYSTKLVKAFAGYYGISADYVTAGNGSDELISIIETAFLKKGDKLLVINPDFSMYQFYSSICEVSTVVLSKDDDLQINIDRVIETVNNENINAVVFSNPCNPTAQGIVRDDIMRLVTSVKALVVVDEAYMDFWNQSIIDQAHKYDNLILLRTASKAMGIAGVRLGFAVANKKITNALKAIKSPYNVNSVSQAIGEVVYHHKEYLHLTKKTIVNNKDFLYNGLIEIMNACQDFKVFESCANFVFVKTSMCGLIFDYLIENSVVIRKYDGYIRITSGTMKENERLLTLMKSFFKSRLSQQK